MTNLASRRFRTFDSPQNFSAAHLACDQMLSGFSETATEARSLFAMTAGSFVYRASKLALFASPLARISSQAIRLFAPALSLGAEVSAYQALTGGQGSRDWLARYVDFTALKLFGQAGRGANPLLMHALQGAGVVAGQSLAHALAGQERVSGSLAERFFRAEAMNWSLRAGQGLVHYLGGASLQRLESSWDLRASARDRAGNPLARTGEGLARMASPEMPGRPSPEIYWAQQQRLLLSENDQQYSHSTLHNQIELRPEELPHVLRWKNQGRILSVSVLIRDEAGRVLVSYDRKGTGHVPRVPSGGAEPSDRTIFEVAEREMREELGAEVEIVRRVAWYRILFTHQGEAVHPWNTLILEGRLRSPIALPEGGELRAVEWREEGSPLHFSMEGFFPGFDETANYFFRAYRSRYPLRVGGLPWRDSETLESLLCMDPNPWIERAKDIDYGMHRLHAWESAGDLQHSHISPYASMIYRFYSAREPLHRWSLTWNPQRGVARMQDEGRQAWLEQVGIHNESGLAEFVGAKLRAHNRRAFRNAIDSGAQASELGLAEFLRGYHSGSHLQPVQESGSEAFTYLLVDGRGAPAAVAKSFKRSDYRVDAGMLANDQLLAMLNGQEWIERAGIQGLRYARIRAFGPAWLLREHLPEEQLGLRAEDDARVAALGRELDRLGHAAHPAYRLVGVAVKKALIPQHYGRNLARETLPDGSTGYVIYDPI